MTDRYVLNQMDPRRVSCVRMALSVLLWLVYGWIGFVSIVNLIFMRRPKPVPLSNRKLCILIPARNEAENLKAMLPALCEKARVFVFDDESEDNTSQVAEEAGAVVIRPSRPLPQGWTGKNRACHELGTMALSHGGFDWLIFLDADTRPGPEFLDAAAGLIESVGPRAPVMTGFLKLMPGAGIEPLFLGWVFWVLLATNPFGLVSRTGIGHNWFLNGQFSIWQASTYDELQPHLKVKDKVLEDVEIGRFLARSKIPVEVVDMSSYASVEMYQSFREAWRGMGKNTYSIVGSPIGAILFTAFFLFAGFAWLFAGSIWLLFLGILVASKMAADRVMKAPVWTAFFMPITCLLAAATVLNSWWMTATGAIEWKGRKIGQPVTRDGPGAS